MVRYKKPKDPEKIRKTLEKHQRSERLLENEDFKEWRLEMELIARMEGLNSLRPQRSNADRMMASGILDFIERRFTAMERQARPEALKKLKESLGEAENGQRVTERVGKLEPSGFAGIAAIGEF